MRLFPVRDRSGVMLLFHQRQIHAR